MSVSMRDPRGGRHLVLKRNFARQRAVNVDGSVIVAEACLRHGVKRLIHTSTVDALGTIQYGLADETGAHTTMPAWATTTETPAGGRRRVRSYAGRGLEVVVIYPGSMRPL